MNLYYQKHERQINAFVSYNMQYALHLHRQVEILYLLEGQLIVKHADQTDMLYAGDLFWAFPNILHSYERSGDTKSILIIFDPELSGDYQNTYHAMAAIHPIIKRANISPEISHCIHVIAEHLHDYSPSLLKGYLAVLTGHLQASTVLQKTDPETSGNITEIILSYISGNFLNDISLETIARHAGISTYKVSRIFTGQLHISFTSYLNSLRIGYAQHLLTDVRLSITDIAYRSGFESQRTFNRVFKSLTSQTPKEYRACIVLVS